MCGRLSRRQSRRVKFIVAAISIGFFLQISRTPPPAVGHRRNCQPLGARGGLAQTVTAVDEFNNIPRSQPPLPVAFNLRPPVVRTFYYGAVNRPHIGYGGKSARELFEARGWMVPEKDGKYSNEWDLLWTFGPQYAVLPPGMPRRWQKHNHCLGLPEAWGIHGTKDSQWACYVEMRRRFGRKRYNYMPETFALPSELRLWMSATVADPGALWIFKPSFGARGQGIRVLDAVPKDATVAETRAVVQRYIPSPMLYNQRKFHLRLYVVISNLNPLRVLLSHTGMMMVAAEPFSVDQATFNNQRVHLTNSAVGATVHHVSEFWQHLDRVSSSGLVNRSTLWAALSDLAVKVVFSSQVGPVSATSRFGFEARRSGTCFNLFGYEIRPVSVAATEAC